MGGSCETCCPLFLYPVVGILGGSKAPDFGVIGKIRNFAVEMVSNNRIHRIAAAVMLLIYVGLYGGSTFFIHFHNVGDSIVWHSHPYSQKHSHSNDTLLSIAQLNAVSANVAVPDVAQCFAGEPVAIIAPLPERNVVAHAVKAVSLRAPPML